jgi:hypothetical protein
MAAALGICDVGGRVLEETLLAVMRERKAGD